MHRIATSFFLSLLTLGAPAAMAEEGPAKDQFLLSLLGGWYEEPNELDLTNGDEGLGGGLGYAITDKWIAEALYFGFKPQAEVGGVKGKAELDYWSVNLMRTLGPGKHWKPYVAIGGGRGEYDYGSLRGDATSDIYNLGLGFFKNLNDNLMFRADVRALYHEDQDEVRPMAMAGITLLIGDRPAPMVAAAPPPADSDGDGVTDDRDECPGTPPGVEVDSVGCPLDSDGDGVPDYRDDCPGTPAGAKVDERGCELILEKPVSFDLTVEFAFDSAEITSVAFQEMLELLNFLREYPSTSAVIEGHTDSLGTDEYNQNLSERRAQAVMQALTNSGISASRLSAVGYGESRPIANNATEEGRQKNRRVTVVVSGTTKAD